MKRTISFGKYAINNPNIKNNEITIDLELRETEHGLEFSACADVWNARHTDCLMVGQCLDTLQEKYIHGNKLYNEIVDLWKKHHLNGLNPGTPEQMKCIQDHKNEINEEDGWYLKELNLLKKYGLDVVEYNGKPYKYGTAWIYREIPQKDLDRIKEIINGK